MLLAVSKVHELFAEVHRVHGKSTSDFFAAILRSMIQNHVVSGKMTLEDFYSQTHQKRWMDHLTASVGSKKATEFHSILMELPKSFSVVKSTSAPTRKERWMQLMLPLAKEFDTDAELLEGIYALFEAETTKLKPLLDMGKALFDKSASW